ncbi:MAG: molybdopterin-binding/glycosyltransferase family 2 protein [Rhizobiaceae bacterium]
MKFGPVELDKAEGAILAHALVLPDGSRFRKGMRLTREHIDQMRSGGVGSVIAAMLGTDDVGEDEAATLVAGAISGANLRIENAATGRVNIYSESNGLFFADPQIITRLNRIDPGITVATLASPSDVNAGRMVATVKIIPYAVSRKSVNEALGTGNAPVIRVDPYGSRRIGVVATRLASLKPSVMDKTIRVLKARLEPSGSILVRELRVDHAMDAIAAAIGELAPDCDFVLVFGASAISDMADVIPSAIRSLGGRIVHFGMPVDPGNLLLIGDLDGKPVIGAPGCARSPAENGFDWVLQRLLAGGEVTADEITAMGVGGLLMEIGTRPQPRETNRTGDPAISAIVLAAGQSTRMGEMNKLAAMLDGKAMVRHVVENALAAGLGEVIVVTGHEAERIRGLLEGLDVRFVHNDAYGDGMGTSVAAGARAVSATAKGVMVLLGDMPLIDATMVGLMRDAFADSGSERIVAASHGGKRGNPVLWPSGYLGDLATLGGDRGARDLVGDETSGTILVELGKAASLDLDTPSDLSAFKS